MTSGWIHHVLKQPTSHNQIHWFVFKIWNPFPWCQRPTNQRHITNWPLCQACRQAPISPQIILPLKSRSLTACRMALRLRRICSTDDFFHKRPNALTTHLIKREYKHCFIQQEINKVRLIPRSHALETSIRQESDRVAFVVTFNPALPKINHIFSGNLNILHFSQRCKEALTSPPLISYRRCNNLRDILVRAKHSGPPSKTPVTDWTEIFERKVQTRLFERW